MRSLVDPCLLSVPGECATLQAFSVNAFLLFLSFSDRNNCVSIEMRF